MMRDPLRRMRDAYALNASCAARHLGIGERSDDPAGGPPYIARITRWQFRLLSRFDA